MSIGNAFTTKQLSVMPTIHDLLNTFVQLSTSNRMASALHCAFYLAGFLFSIVRSSYFILHSYLSCCQVPQQGIRSQDCGIYALYNI
jgi:hypothetical protein